MTCNEHCEGKGLGFLAIQKPIVAIKVENKYLEWSDSVDATTVVILCDLLKKCISL